MKVYVVFPAGMIDLRQEMYFIFVYKGETDAIKLSLRTIVRPTLLARCGYGSIKPPLLKGGGAAQPRRRDCKLVEGDELQGE